MCTNKHTPHYHSSKSQKLTKTRGFNELIQYIVEGQPLQFDIRVHGVQVRGEVGQAQLVFGPEEGDGEQRRLGRSMPIKSQLREAGGQGGSGVVDSGQGKFCWGHQLGGEASSVELLNLHLDGRAAASFKEVYGFSQELMLSSMFVSACVAQKNLQLWHPQAHHHLLQEKERPRAAEINTHILSQLDDNITLPAPNALHLHRPNCLLGKHTYTYSQLRHWYTHLKAQTHLSHSALAFLQARIVQ